MTVKRLSRWLAFPLFLLVAACSLPFGLRPPAALLITPTQTRMAPTLEAFVMTEVSELQARPAGEGVLSLHGYPAGALGGTPQPVSTGAYLETRALATAYAYVTAHAQGTRFYQDPAGRAADLTVTADTVRYATAAAQATLWQHFLQDLSSSVATVPAADATLPSTSPDPQFVSPSLHRFSTPTPPAPSATATILPQDGRFQTIPSPAPAVDSDGARLTTWELVPDSGAFPLRLVTRAAIGVYEVAWAPDGRSLWLGLDTDRHDRGELQAMGVVISFDRRLGWLAARSFNRIQRQSFSWSPNGRWLAYLDSGQLWLAEAGGAQRRLLDFPNGLRGDSDVAFSPDGGLISVLASRQAGSAIQYDRLVFDVAYGQPIQALLNVGRGPAAWSPTGARLAQLGAPQRDASNPERLAVWIWEVESGRVEVTALPGTGETNELTRLDNIAWVLDGRKLLINHLKGNELWLMDLQNRFENLHYPDTHQTGQVTSGQVRLAQTDGVIPVSQRMGGPYCFSANLSPDGRYLVYSLLGDRLTLVDLLTNERRDYHPADLGGTNLCYGYTRIRWAPPAAFQTPHFLFWDFNLVNQQPSNMRLVDVASGSVEVLPVAGVYPSWSPDGRLVAFGKPQITGTSLWVLDLSTGEQQELAAVPPDLGHRDYRPHYWPTWSPNGEWIALTGGASLAPQAYLLDVYPLIWNLPAP